MKKRGARFKGQVFGSPRVADAQRAAHREINTEAIAMKIRRLQTPERLSRDQIINLAASARLALEDVRKGSATNEGVGWLVNAANMALVIAELGLGGEYLDDIRASQDALIRMLQRHGTHGRYALDGPGLAACVQMLDVHQAQLESEDMTDMVMWQAIDTCHARQAAGQVLEIRVGEPEKQADSTATVVAT